MKATKQQIVEARTVKEANFYLKKGWYLIRCLVQRDKRGESPLYVLKN